MLIIRDYNRNDLESIVKLEERAFEVGPYTIHMLREILHNPESYSLVAMEGDFITGYITIFPIDKLHADIESLAVDPDFAGRGIGKGLMMRGEEWMKKNQFRYSVLEVRDKNDIAIALYVKLGYIIKEKLHAYYELEYHGSRDAYRMEKDLELEQ